MARKLLSRSVLTLAAASVTVAGLTYALRPQPTLVDLGAVTRGPIAVTIEEEGRTRVRELYSVSTPVDGRLMRVEVEPGDAVIQGETIVARMLPANPAALDVRTRQQARAAVAAAEAGLNVARADEEAARAALELAQADLARTRRLAERGIASQAALDRVEGEARAALARRETASAAIAQREAEVRNAQAQLIGFEDPSLLAALSNRIHDQIPIFAPANGRILRVIHEDETTLGAGAPILEIGDIGEDLEIMVELLSSDAVQVAVGNPVIIRDWGGLGQLSGTVMRVEPFARSKVSALGVEEQRVTVVAELNSPPEERPGLGHGFRVTAGIVVWEAEDTVTAPASALFRSSGGWAAFVLEGGIATERPVSVGRANGVSAQVLDGLAEGETVVLYPPPGLTDGAAIQERTTE